MNNNIDHSALLKKIQALSFAKVEAELYLDAHPDCAVALEYYKNVVKEYNELAQQYENMHAPLRQENVAANRWTWVDTPWPWQLDGNGKEK